MHKVYGLLQTSHSQVQKDGKENQGRHVEGSTTISYCHKKLFGTFIAKESRGEGELKDFVISHFILPFSLKAKQLCFTLDFL